MPLLGSFFIPTDSLAVILPDTLAVFIAAASVKLRPRIVILIRLDIIADKGFQRFVRRFA